MGDFDKTLGTVLIGIVLNTYLYGLVSYQFVAYYDSKLEDPIWIRCIVFVLFCVDTFHSAALAYMAWAYCITNFDNPAILAKALWPFTFTPIGTAIAAIFTHIFLGYRIMRLTNNRYIYMAILVLAAVSFALGLACGIWSWILTDVVKFGVLQPIVTAWLSFQVGTDLLITVILTTVLYRSRTGFHKTDTVIKRLMRGSIQTGVFSSIFSLCDLITFLVATDSNLYGMFAFPVGRIYTNTLMDTLLSRSKLQDVMAADSAIQSPGNAIWATGPNMAAQNDIRLHNIQVRTVTEVYGDGQDREGPADEDLKYPSS